MKPRFQRDLRRHLLAKVELTWTEEDVLRADTDLNRACVFFGANAIPILMSIIWSIASNTLFGST